MPPPTSEHIVLQAGLKFGNGRFVLARLLGSGGMGEVWLAQDERLHEPVALKFVPQKIRGDPAMLDGLRRETVRSHKLSHANIVRIHDLHEDPDGTAFIVMEYIDGPTLSTLREQQPNGVMAWSFLRPLVEQLCVALDYAHGESVIHRDLKPANMMVDARGRLKLADFGLAAVVVGDGAGRDAALHPGGGTINYMSPQQLTRKSPQATDDIYALGATLYELLTGQMPFHTGDLAQQVLHESPEPVFERLAKAGIQNEFPADVAALVMACLVKEPEKRPQSARAVAEWIGLELNRKPALENLTNDVCSVEEAAPEMETGKSVKKPLLWSLAAFVAIAVLGAGGWYWLKHKNASVASIVSHKPTVTDDIAWVPLFNGLTLSGWKSPDGGHWKVGDDGSIIGDGPRGHLLSPKKYTNLEFKAEIKLSPGADGGMFFRTKYINREMAGYEAQAYNGTRGPRSGALIHFQKASEDVGSDEVWFLEHVIAISNHIVIKVDDAIVVNYIDTNNTYSWGRLALQHWNPPAHSTTAYRNVMVKPLPDDEAAAWAEARKDIPNLAR